MRPSLRDAACDTSVLQYMHQIGCLHFLPSMTRSVIVPPSVVTEIANGRARGVDLPETEELPWIQVKIPTKPHAILDAARIGQGERDVLKFAFECPGTVALLDDRLARRYARSFGIPAIGTLGLLLEAKHFGLINSVRPFVSELQRRGFRCSSSSREHILRAANES